MAKRTDKRGRPSPHLTDDERALWRHVTRADAPLDPPGQAGPPEPDTPPARPRPRLRAGGASMALKSGTKPTLSPDLAAGLDKRSAQRLRRGKTPIEARLDLHGLTQTEAHAALNGFIANAAESGKRCVLVITGKGVDRDRFVGTLRSMTPRWLNEPPLRDVVLGYSEATARDGGAGALYVLLRRRR